MVYRGRVENGLIRLDESVLLPEGAEVDVLPLARQVDEDSEPAGASLYDRLKPVIGAAKGLPEDLAQNHDHYLHGRIKK